MFKNQTAVKNLVGIMVLSLFGNLAQADDVINDAWTGIRADMKNKRCRIQHRQLDYSKPEMFISFQLADDETYPDADTGLVSAQDISLQDYRKLMNLGNPATLSANFGHIYTYVVTAQNLNANSRQILIEGINNEKTRKTSVKIINSLESSNMKIKEISMVKSHLSTGLFGGKTWKEIFSDKCINLKNENK